MSIATLYGIGSALVPGPRLIVKKDANGIWTGVLTFTCAKFQLMTVENQGKLTKGTLLSTLYPEAGDAGFLQLMDWDSEDQPGGYTEVTVNFAGSNLEDPFDEDDGVNVSFTRNDATKEESIFKHPRYIAETTPDGKIGIKACYDKIAYNDAGTGTIKLIANKQYLASLSTEDDEWYQTIIVEGFDTYLKPTSEWTKSSTGIGTIPSGITERMGKRETPEGNPNPPAGDSWILSGATESLQVKGDGVNAYSLTWTSGYFPSKIFTDPA